MNAFVSMSADLIKGDPFAIAALDPADRPSGGELTETTTIYVSVSDAEALAALPAGEDVSARVLDAMTGNVLWLCREEALPDEVGTLFGSVDRAAPAGVAERWTALIAAPPADWVDDFLVEMAR